MKLLLNYALLFYYTNTKADDINVEASNKPFVYKEILKSKLHF